MIDKFFAFLNYFFFEKFLIDDYRNILKEILYILSERVNFILFLFYLSTITLVILLFSKNIFFNFSIYSQSF